MLFNECAAAVGASAYPPYFPELYDAMTADGSIDSTKYTSEDYIRGECTKYGLFITDDELELLDLVVKAAREIEASKALLRFTNLMTRATLEKRGGITLPWPKEPTLATDFMGFIAMIPSLEGVHKNMVARNIPEYHYKRVFSTFKGVIKIHITRFGRPALNQTYFSWQHRFLVPDIYDFGGFNMQMVNSYAGQVYMLRHKQTREFELVINNAVMHRDGMVLGSAGYEDETGSYKAEFVETDEYYEGCPCDRSGFCTGVVTRYPKSLWEIALRPGDAVISVHIPRGAKLAGNALQDGIAESLEMFKVHYPEFKPKAVYCSSWLMDTRIDAICGGAPNIKNFQKPFHAFPVRSAGREVFSFVFIHPFDKYEDLPEDTRLMRALKKRYIEGDHLHAFGGLYPIDYEVNE